MAGLISAADLIGQLFKGDFHVFGPPGSNPWAAVDPRAFKVSFGTIQTNYLGLKLRFFEKKFAGKKFDVFTRPKVLPDPENLFI